LAYVWTPEDDKIFLDNDMVSETAQLTKERGMESLEKRMEFLDKVDEQFNQENEENEENE
jgi:hypothetical protein